MIQTEQCLALKSQLLNVQKAGERNKTQPCWLKYHVEKIVYYPFIFEEYAERLTWVGLGCEVLSCSQAVALWSGSARGSFVEVCLREPA